MAEIVQKVNKKNGFDEVKYRILYGYYFLGRSITHLSIIFHMSTSTISDWISHYEESGKPHRTRIPSTFDKEKQQWFVNLYHENPIIYLDEAKTQFYNEFNITISSAYICKILHTNNISWETLEKRAIQVKELEIVKFMGELNAIDWCYSNIAFLDEVSMDDQGLLSTQGYGVIGEKLMYRGEVTRKPVKSMLVFLGQNGILEVYGTEGSFSRRKFVEYCRDFALGGTCHQYPGRNSVWFLDDAKIHCHPNIIYYLRSLGILPIFLPAYTPFFNPIEYIFDEVKKNVKQKSSGSKKNMEMLVIEEFTRMQDFRCTEIFKKCGFVTSGKFDPRFAYEENENYFGFESMK